jgi:hypothetical protein
MEQTNYDIHVISSMLRPLSVKWLYYLVRKSDFDKLSPELKVWACNATDGLIEALGFSYDRKTETIYLFTSEAKLLSGMRALCPNADNGEHKFLPITVSPEIFFEALVRLSPKVIEIDYLGENSLRFEGDNVKLLERVAEHYSFCQFQKVCLVEETRGYAFSVELDGKEYALVFLTEDGAKPTMEGLKLTNPGSKLKRNNLKSVVEGILSSTFEGLLLNPASSNQIILSRKELELCLVLIDAIQGKAESAPKRMLNKFLGKS